MLQRKQQPAEEAAASRGRSSREKRFRGEKEKDASEQKDASEETVV